MSSGDYAGDMPLEPDDSHDMDMVTLFSSSNHDAEMEATQIHGMLESNGIPSILVGNSTLPVLAFEVQVPKENLEEAERVLAAAQAAGPAAAAEAELAGEEGA
jgi:Putative prokaryotic signal transducing protein